jgi:hypothetical protein
MWTAIRLADHALSLHLVKHSEFFLISSAASLRHARRTLPMIND